MNQQSLAERTSEVAGWDSFLNNWDSEKQVLVRDSSTETVKKQIENDDKCSGTQEESKDIGIQASTSVLSNSTEEIDKKLALWLRKIMPALEKELNESPTKVQPSGQKPFQENSFAKVTEYQEIYVNSNFSDLKINDELIIGNFLWLSVTIQNNPSLVITCSSKNSPEKDSSPHSYLLLFEPHRDSTNGNVYWKKNELSLPINNKLDYLVINSENRDIFAAGASTSGDFFVWEYVKSSYCASKIVELFSKTGQGAINALTFSADNILICLSDGGVIQSYKIMKTKNFVSDKTMKIDEKVVKTKVVITAITSISESNDFIVGLLNGKILYCSSNNQQPTHNVFMNPIVKELSSQKFAIKSLKHVNHLKRNFIVSFDASSEIFIHEIDGTQEKILKYVIRLPLPMKHFIAFSKNMEHIFCPLPNGNLEIFNARNHTRQIIESNQLGSRIMVELSKNESWLITGIFKGTLKIYHVSYDE